MGRVATAIISTFSTELDGVLVSYEAFKKRAAVLDFDDLLFTCRDVLRAYPQVRAAAAERFSRILVDEFQDTDSVQAEIMFLLCGSGDDAEIWYRRQLNPGQLFLVGERSSTRAGCAAKAPSKLVDFLSAKEADAALKKKAPIGPLHGVPVTIKLNVDVKGEATTNGAAANRNLVAPEDSAVLANLRKAGAIILGHTNTPPFSHRWFAENPLRVDEAVE